MDSTVSNFNRHFPHLTVHLKNATNDSAVAHLCHAMFFTDIFQGPILKEENIPETLAFDIIRLGNFQREIRYFAIIVNVCAFLKRNNYEESDVQEVLVHEFDLIFMWKSNALCLTEYRICY